MNDPLMRKWKVPLTMAGLLALWLLMGALITPVQAAVRAQSVPIDTTSAEGLSKLADVLQTSLLVVVLLVIVLMLWRAYQAKVDELHELQTKHIEWLQSLMFQRVSTPAFSDILSKAGAPS